MTHPIESSFLPGALPSYKNPPVNEVVCGMRFQVPDKLRIPHIGFLWDKLRADYPIIQHASPLASVKGEILVDEATGMPLPRVWFINKSDDQLVQFQIDRFYFNWRRRQSNYPRYDHVIRNFESVLNNIVNFFGEFELGELKPIEYELSYINHIPKGQGWNTIDDLPRIFSDFVWKQTKARFLSNPEKVAWQTEFPFQEKKGHLIVNLKQATRTEDKVPLLVLELKTRAIGESASKEAVREWFDLAHEWIVRGFTDLTTPEIQKFGSEKIMSELHLYEEAVQEATIAYGNKSLIDYSSIGESDAEVWNRGDRLSQKSRKASKDIYFSIDVSQESRKVFIRPWIEKKDTCTQEDLLDSEEDQVKELIFRIRRSKSIPHPQSLANRLLALFNDAKEENPASLGISAGSLCNFYNFLRLHTNLKCPTISLTPEDNIYASWRGEQKRIFSVHFLPNGDARFVIFIPNVRHPERQIRISGAVTTDILMETVTSYHVCDWIS